MPTSRGGFGLAFSGSWLKNCIKGCFLTQKKGGVASSAGKRGTGIEDNKLNLIQSMEIFDYTNAIYYAKLPFPTNGSCLNKWDGNRRSYSRQTNPAGILLTAAHTTALGRLGDSATLEVRTQCQSCDLSMSFPIPVSAHPASLIRKILPLKTEF